MESKQGQTAALPGERRWLFLSDAAIFERL